MSDWTDAVTDLVAGDVRLYRVNEVPAKPTYPYASFSVIDGRGDSLTLDGRPGLRWSLAPVQAFGRTLDGAAEVMRLIRDRLEGECLDVQGYDCSPVELPMDPQINRDPDDNGVVTLTAAFTFTATKEA